MLVATNKRDLDVLLLLSSKINQLGVMLQSKIIDHVELNGLHSNVSVDLISKFIWLRVELIGQNVQQDGGIFENDIINIKIKDDVIFLTCSVYSSYGVDSIINYHDKVDDFNVNILDDIFPLLLSCVNEHVNHYI